MASTSLGDEINCSICMNIYTNPVTLSCGHNFCLDCIKRTWDHQEEGEFSCPECRQRFRSRPKLKVNWKLRNIADCLRLSQPMPKNNRTCTYCDDVAAKTCLQCAIFLCEKHLSIHNTSAGHDLTEPTSLLENRRCTVHNELVRYFCTEHATCICLSCSVSNEHRGHQVESLIDAFKKKKLDLRKVLGKLTTKRKETEQRVSSLKEHKKEIEEKAKGIELRVTVLIKDIKEQLDNIEKKALSEISRQKELVLTHISDLIQQLKMKRDELFGKILHIEELCNMNNPFTVLQGQESERDAFCDAKKVEVEDRERDDERVHAAVNLDEILISMTLQTTFANCVTRLKAKNLFFLPSMPDLELDIHTAANNIVISRDLKKATWTLMSQCHPRTPNRLETCQVLSTTSIFSKQYYWEIETSDSGEFHIGISYSNLKMDGTIIGFNRNSWCLRLSENNIVAIHDSKETLLHTETSCKRLGLYLDYEAGCLSFYQLCGPIRFLHTFKTTFTEPLYAMFYIFNGWVRIRN